MKKKNYHLKDIQIRGREIFKQKKVRRVFVFGSFARGDFKKNSDIDLLIDFRVAPSFFGLVSLENNLSKLFGRRVEITTHGQLTSRFKKRIADDLVRII